jgi:glycosyltransferase involved in cell wall biosynthesis
MMAYAGRILIIVENLPVPFDSRVWQEANALTEAGYKVSIISPKGKGYEAPYEFINNIAIYRHSLAVEGNGLFGYLREYAEALFWELYLSIKVFFKEGFDVIHACNPPDDIFIIGAIWKLFGKKFVFDHHDINPELYIAKFNKKGLFYKLLLWLERMTFRTANISLATNLSYKEIAINRGKMKEENVFVVRSGPDLTRIREVPKKENLKEGKKYMVGYIGVMGQQEGLDYLIRSIKYIVSERKRKDIIFVLVGGGPALQSLKEYAAQQGLNDYIKFTGRVSDEVLLEYLNTSDICVAPDLYNEMNDKSTMNKILEYMALGKPIVLFDLKEGRYSAQKAALYARPNDEVDFADKMLELIDDEDKRKIMGQYGKRRINDELKWDITKQELIKAYSYLFRNPT